VLTREEGEFGACKGEDYRKRAETIPPKEKNNGVEGRNATVVKNGLINFLKRDKPVENWGR